MLDSNSLYLTDENGNEKRMIILFTFDSEDYDAQYVVFQDPDTEEVYATRYTDEGELLPIENDDEWEMVEEVINTFDEVEEDA